MFHCTPTVANWQGVSTNGKMWVSSMKTRTISEWVKVIGTLLKFNHWDYENCKTNGSGNANDRGAMQKHAVPVEKTRISRQMMSARWHTRCKARFQGPIKIELTEVYCIKPRGIEIEAAAGTIVAPRKGIGRAMLPQFREEIWLPR